MLARTVGALALGVLSGCGRTQNDALPLLGSGRQSPRVDVASTCLLDGAVAGTWEATDSSTRAVLFHDRKYAIAEDGALSLVFSVVDCASDRIEICAYGRKRTIALAVSGDALELTPIGGAAPRQYVRGGSAEQFEPKPMAMPMPGSIAVDVDRADEINSELLRRLEADQRVRRNLPGSSDEMAQVDADNVTYLVSLMTEIGWVDEKRFGAGASRAAFLIVQHSKNLALMLATLDYLDRDTRGSDYALLCDRTLLRLGEPQRYGTQLTSDANEEMALQPLEDPGKVDVRRAELGLSPLADYLGLFGLTQARILSCE